MKIKTKYFLSLVIVISAYKTINAQSNILKDIFERRDGSDPKEFQKIGQRIYFTANNGANGIELWKTDGNTESTNIVKDIFSLNDNSSSPENLTSVNNVLYFSAVNGINGRELWKSNGELSGTSMVKNIWPFDKVKKTDGSSDPKELTEVNKKLFFSADNSSNGRELWLSDGTTLGTLLIKDILVGKTSSNPENLTNVNGVLYFTADNGINGRELWKSDGTTKGTFMIKDIIAGSKSSNPCMLTNVNGVLYFMVSNGHLGEELWKSDGTIQGTEFIKDFNTSFGTNAKELMNTNKFVVLNNSIYFIEENGSKGYLELWKSDGTSAGTILIKSLGNSSHMGEIRNITEYNNGIYFIFKDGDIWKCDEKGVSKTDIADEKDSRTIGRIYALTNVNGTIFFTKAISIGSNTVYSLWLSKGTLSDTKLILNDIKTYVESNSYFNLNNKFFFVADDKIHGNEIWYIENN